jgi:hypothetical protein
MSSVTAGTAVAGARMAAAAVVVGATGAAGGAVVDPPTEAAAMAGLSLVWDETARWAEAIQTAEPQPVTARVTATAPSHRSRPTTAEAKGQRRAGGVARSEPSPVAMHPPGEWRRGAGPS